MTHKSFTSDHVVDTNFELLRKRQGPRYPHVTELNVLSSTKSWKIRIYLREPLSILIKYKTIDTPKIDNILITYLFLCKNLMLQYIVFTNLLKLFVRS